MAYRMSRVSDRVKIGQRSDGSFDIEVYTPSIDNPESTVEEIFLPIDAAQDVAHYLIRNA